MAYYSPNAYTSSAMLIELPNGQFDMLIEDGIGTILIDEQIHATFNFADSNVLILNSPDGLIANLLNDAGDMALINTDFIQISSINTNQSFYSANIVPIESQLSKVEIPEPGFGLSLGLLFIYSLFCLNKKC